MDITQATEESLLRLKDDLVNDVKNLKNKSNKKKAVFLVKTLTKAVLVAGGITTALFFPPAIVIAALGGAVALVDMGSSTVTSVRGIKKSKEDKKTKLTDLKTVSEQLIREQVLKEVRNNPTAPPLYPSLEISKE